MMERLKPIELEYYYVNAFSVFSFCVGCGPMECLSVEVKCDEGEIVGEIGRAADLAIMCLKGVHHGRPGVKWPAEVFEEFHPSPQRAVATFNLLGVIAEEEGLTGRFDLRPRRGVIEVRYRTDHGYFGFKSFNLRFSFGGAGGQDGRGIPAASVINGAGRIAINALPGREIHPDLRVHLKRVVLGDDELAGFEEVGLG